MARGSVFGELCLNRLPDRLIENWPVFAGTGLPLVDDLAGIGAVLQYRVERTAREWSPADGVTRSARPRLASDAAGVELSGAACRRVGDKWHLDEVVLKIAGVKHWSWRAVDQTGIVLDVVVQRRRDKQAAKRLLRKLLKKRSPGRD